MVEDLMDRFPRWGCLPGLTEMAKHRKASHCSYFRAPLKRIKVKPPCPIDYMFIGM